MGGKKAGDTNGMIKRGYAFCKYGAGLIGLVLILVSVLFGSPIIRYVFILLGLVIGIPGCICSWNTLFSRNQSKINPKLHMVVKDIVKDKWHNSNTDIVFYKGMFYVAHAVSPMHLGSTKCRIEIKRSKDCESWEKVAEFRKEGEDIRDPKLAVVKNRLYIYVLLNVATQPRPYITRVSFSDDGVHFTGLSPIKGCNGWLFWRPKTYDGETWYCPAYWHKFNKTALFKSQDGLTWEQVSIIYEGGAINESGLAFKDNGDMVVAGRLEYSKDFKHIMCGHYKGSTLISVAKSPYSRFMVQEESKITRLDGLVLFTVRDRLFATGRRQPKCNKSYAQVGSIFAKKRTALYEIRDDGMVFISDLPSAGDTAYGGAVVYEEKVYLTYYTSPVDRDYLWFFGMIEPSAVKLVTIDVENILKA